MSGRAEDGTAEGAPHPDEPGRGPAEGPWPQEPLGLWQGFGVEIELVVVDRETLDVRPVADRLMEAATGRPGAAEVERGEVDWSNELALHVLELKTHGPAPSLHGLHRPFEASLAEADALLEPMGCRLLPGGMHPWMDPHAELRLWPHEYTEVYRTFDRIFSCRGHGWANLQSTHLNLPYRGDAEFVRLHDAIRLVLPLLPALAASSPFLDGDAGPALDNRLEAYRRNARRVPSVTGAVVPERVGSREAYRREVLERIYRDLEPLDPEGILRDEWVNARGAIARFGRGAIEIRVLDAQECPRADLAVVAATVAAVRAAAEGPLAAGESPDVDPEVLARLLDETIRAGGRARLDDPRLRELLDLPTRVRTVADAWAHRVEAAGLLDAGGGEWREPLRAIVERGTLAERLRRAAGLPALPAPGQASPDPARLRMVYRRLADHLTAGEVF